MSFGKYFLQLNIGLLAFLAGYSFCRYVHADCKEDKRYIITREKEQPFLYDRNTNQKLPLLENPLQLGNLEYRLTNVLAEPNLAHVLDTLPDGEHHE